MTITKTIIETIEKNFRLRSFASVELTRTLRAKGGEWKTFQSGRYLEHLTRLGILRKEKQNGRENTYSPGKRWNERDKILADYEAAGALAKRVWSVIVEFAGKPWTVSDVHASLRSQYSLQQVRQCVSNLRNAGAVRSLYYAAREMLYEQAAGERSPFK